MHTRRLFQIVSVTLILGFLLGFAGPAQAARSHQLVQASGPLYVKANAIGSDDGTSWTDAYTSLQSALAVANSGDQIWVAAGTYLPTADADRTISFMLKDGVAIYGGFVGAAGTEGDFTPRDPVANVTILSGDIGVSDDASDNSYHVVVGSGVSSSAVLDGFTITAGNANADPWYSNNDGYGGGLYNDGGSPVLTNVTFSANSAGIGGGMTNLNGSDPMLTNVTFSGNASADSGGMYNASSSPTLTDVNFNDNTAAYGGGGMFNLGGSDPILTHVTFSGNVADPGGLGCGGCVGGGGMYNAGSSPALTDVIFSANSAVDSGGGMLNDWDGDNNGSNPTLTNVTFSGNTAQAGGGLANWDNSNPTLTGVTFNNNTATSSDTNYGGGGMYNYNSSPTLTDVTFSNNSSSIQGGGLNNQLSSPQLTNVTFSGNTATVFGGGMAVGMADDTTSSTLTNVIFSGNTALIGGGMVGGNDVLTDVTFSGNTAEAGGGMGVGGSAQLTNVTFSNNIATGTSPYSEGGGGMLICCGTPTLTNVTFSGNTAAAGAGAIYNDGSYGAANPRVRNSIFWGDMPEEIANVGTSTATIQDSIVAGGCPSGSTCKNVLNADPKLGPLQDNGGFTKTRALLPGSAAIDRGGVNAACAPKDQRGITRPQGPACDIGAFELVQYTISGNIGVANGILTYKDGTLKTATANASGSYSSRSPQVGLARSRHPSRATYSFSLAVLTPT